MNGKSSATELLRDRWQATMMPNYGVPAVALSHGRGAVVTDVDGRDYLDLIAGIATSTLGHAHPAITAAVAQQVSRLAHTSNLVAHEPGLELAERLVELTGHPARVFLCQDGASANEAAIKLARLYARQVAPGGSKTELIAAEGSFHGRTLGALSITGSPGKREPFEPLIHPVRFVPFGDAEALAAAVGPQTAAVFLEPIQGEAGVIVPPEGYLARARAVCDKHNALLVVDEVQSGMGRTGEWFASLSQGVRPDVITLAKGLAGGLPLGACLGFGAVGELFAPGDHGSTFGGNPVSCAAALAVIETIRAEDLLTSVKSVGEQLRADLDAVGHPLLVGTRGAGLWLALQLSAPQAKQFETAARELGFLVNAVQPDAVRLAPPLIVTSAQAATFTAAVPRILDLAAQERQ